MEEPWLQDATDLAIYPSAKELLHSMIDNTTLRLDWTRLQEATAAGADAVPPQPKRGTKGEDETGGQLPFTSYAQWKIAHSQSLLDGTPCTKARVLSEKVKGNGLGADVMFMANALAHAMILGRILVPHVGWKWVGGWSSSKEADFCQEIGWGCVFLPPSACTHRDLNVSYMKWAKMHHEIRKPPLAAHRVIHRHDAFAHSDLAWGAVPDLHPPGVTRKQVEAKAGGMPYGEWAQLQLYRYLLRGLQPWAEALFTRTMREKGSGFPWPTERLIVGVHVRNGEDAKDAEMADRLKCRRIDPSLQLHATAAVLSALKTSSRSVVPYFTFDHHSVIDDARAFWAGEGLVTHAPTVSSSQQQCLMTSQFPRFEKTASTTDTRNVIKKLWGQAYLVKMSLTNLFLSASMDAWVNNDASHWCRVIHNVAGSMGRRRHSYPYVPLDELSASLPPAIRQKFCRTKLCTPQELAIDHSKHAGK